MAGLVDRLAKEQAELEKKKRVKALGAKGAAAAVTKKRKPGVIGARVKALGRAVRRKRREAQFKKLVEAGRKAGAAGGIAKKQKK